MRKDTHKPFCKRGHAIAVVGREKGGGCTACMIENHKSDKYQKYHKVYVKKWQEDNREYKSEQIRIWLYKKKFGITIEDYNRMLVEQNNACAICARPQANFKRKFSVDHDHKTGKVCGLLCDNCNHTLGLIYDDLVTLQKMISYLENSSRIPN
ncbi:MAG: endonuclease VII domain-containing protein [bacterium]